MFDRVDPFIGTGATDLPAPVGLAATRWPPKPLVGNTHPGAVFPFGMVSACAYSGAYPTGYGVYDLSTEGVPTRLHDRLLASGITHFQQSGTGAIRKYYNYVRVTPMVGPLDELGTNWEITDEVAEPGYYAATLATGIRCEVRHVRSRPVRPTPGVAGGQRETGSILVRGLSTRWLRRRHRGVRSSSPWRRGRQ